METLRSPSGTLVMECPSGYPHRVGTITGSILEGQSEFSPSLHVHESHGVRTIDYLIISHPDQDHIEDLPHLLVCLWRSSRILLRNRSLPEQEMFGSGQRRYQADFRRLHEAFTHSVGFETSPINPACNGGVEYASGSLDFGTPV